MWWTCLNEGFIMIWLIMLFRSTGSNSGMAAETWVKLPIQCREEDRSFFTQIWNLYITACCFSASIYSFHWSDVRISYIKNVLNKEYICYKYHWVYWYCNGFCANFHNRVRGNWYIFLLFFNKPVFILQMSVISSN